MKRFLQKILGYIKQLSTPFPTRDWYVVLVFSIIVFSILLATALYFFIGIQSGVIITPKESEQIPTPSVSRESINSVLETYNEIKLNFDSGNVKVPDVSNPAR